MSFQAKREIERAARYEHDKLKKLFRITGFILIIIVFLIILTFAFSSLIKNYG